MKKILLIISIMCLFSADIYASITFTAPYSINITLIQRNRNLIREADQTFFAVPGKTWWYQNRKGAINEIAYYGITVGETEDVNGESWNPIYISHFEIVKDNIEVINSNDSIPLGYIKEEGNQIYSLFRNKDLSLDYLGFRPFLNPENNDDYFKYSIYNFGEIGDESYFGDEDEYAKYVIKDIQEVENSGNIFKAYYIDWTDINYRSGFTLLGTSKRYIESVGYDNRLFFMPESGDVSSSISYNAPDLLYVTNPDQSILYKVDDGKESIDNVAIENEYSTIEWYDLNGRKIKEPSIHGVYIKKIGQQVGKYIIH